jgi:hypothetical protein
MNVELFLLILFLVLLVLVIFSSIFFIFVKNKSNYYQRLLRINSRLFTLNMKRSYTIGNHYQIKRSYEKSDVYSSTLEYLKLNFNFFSNQALLAKQNQNNISVYDNEFSALLKEQKMNKPVDKKGKRRSFLFKLVESIILSNSKYNPITAFTLYSFSRYRSEKGRIYLNKYINFNYSEVLKMMEKVRDVLNYEISRIAKLKKERALLSSSMRYDVLKRDSFTCIICGRSKRDGVKLHVDHIFPISKGGKTIKSNLRTLCQECNLGKKDKIEI